MKKKFINKIHSNNCLVPEALERASQEKGGRFQFWRKDVLPDPHPSALEAFPWKDIHAENSHGSCNGGCGGEGTESLAKSEVKTLQEQKSQHTRRGYDRRKLMLSRTGRGTRLRTLKCAQTSHIHLY